MVAVAESSAIDFKAFYSTDWVHAYWTAYKVLRNREDAQDVAQDAFAYVWPWIERGDAVSLAHAHSALLKKVRQLCIDVLRRRHRIDAREDSLDEPRIGSGPDSGGDALFLELRVAPDQLDSLLKASRLALIDAALEILPKRQATAIRMHTNSFSTEEIAYALDTDAANVHVLLCRARTRIQKELLKGNYA